MEEAQQKSFELPANDILRLYNQFPRCYEDIDQMTLHLFEISEMQFNAVWINPIQETGKLKHPLASDPLQLGKNKEAYSGSLYAKKDSEKIDNDFSVEKHNNKKKDNFNILALKNYTKTAKNLGLTPIFDLVLNQVALDAEVYKQRKNWFIPPKWNLYIFEDIEPSTMGKIDISRMKGDCIILIGKENEKNVYFVKKTGKNTNEWYQTKEGNLLTIKIDFTKYKGNLIPDKNGIVKRNYYNGNYLTEVVELITELAKLPPNRSNHFGPYCCDFNFNNPTVYDEILSFIKAEIYTYIVDYGFMGVRVDAVKHLPIKVQREIYEYINELCLKFHSVKAIIFAEVFLNPRYEKLEEVSKNLKGLGITHVTNFLHWEKLGTEYRKHAKGQNVGRWEKPWLSESEWFDKPLGQLYLLRSITCDKSQKILGGSIGFPGCHDTQSLYETALQSTARLSVEANHNFSHHIQDYGKKVDLEVEKLKNLTLGDFIFYLKETIATIAFTSDAGWYLLSGDEFGCSDKKWVFDFYKPCNEGKYFVNRWGGQYDLRPFIKGVNNILQMLSSDSDPIFWVQHIVLEKKPELMIAIRHKGDGYQKIPDIVIVNLSNKGIIFTYSDIIDISVLASHRENHISQQENAKSCVIQAMNTGKIFCLGSIELKNLKNVKVANTKFGEPELEKCIINLADTDKNANDPISCYTLIKNYLTIGNKKEAINSFQILITCNPSETLIKCLYNVGELFLTHTMTEEVLLCYKKIEEFSGQSKFMQISNDYYQLGIKAYKLNNQGLAKIAFLKAYEIVNMLPQKDIKTKIKALEFLEKAFRDIQLFEIAKKCQIKVTELKEFQSRHEQVQPPIAQIPTFEAKK